MLLVDTPVSIGLTTLTPPSSGSVGRIQWMDFLESLPTALHKTIADVPTIEDQAYIRELLQLAVIDDLLGPAGGPRERIVDMGVRDRYLVGKLAPREAAQGGIEGLDGPLANEDAEEPTEAKAPGRHEPGAEFGTATGRVEPDSDSADEIDAASNQSLVPSSLGMTFCVDAVAVDRGGFQIGTNSQRPPDPGDVASDVQDQQPIVIGDGLIQRTLAVQS